MNFFQICTSFAYIFDIFVTKIAMWSILYSLKDIVIFVRSRHLPRQWKFCRKAHLTSSMTFKERKEVFTTCVRWESMRCVDPACGFLGKTEKTYSIPPVTGPPEPAFILILNTFHDTFIDNDEYFCRNKFVSIAECGPTLLTWSLCPALQK